MTPQRVIPKVSQNKLFPFKCQDSLATGRAVRVEKHEWGTPLRLDETADIEPCANLGQ